MQELVGWCAAALFVVMLAAAWVGFFMIAGGIWVLLLGTAWLLPYREGKTMTTDRWFESKRIAAAACSIAAAMLPLLPECGLTPYVPALMAGLATATAILCGVSKFQEGRGNAPGA